MSKKRVTKSYKSIWNVNRTLYSLGDINLPVPLTFGQIGWFVLGFTVMLLLGDALSFIPIIGNFFFRLLVIPIALSAFMSKKTFDGKKPYEFIKSALMYAGRSKTTARGEKLKREKQRVHVDIPIVESVFYSPMSLLKERVNYDSIEREGGEVHLPYQTHRG